MAFDPDAYLASKRAPAELDTTDSGDSFDPDAYLSAKKSGYVPPVIDQTIKPYEPQGFGEKLYQAVAPRTFAKEASGEDTGFASPAADALSNAGRFVASAVPEVGTVLANPLTAETYTGLPGRMADSMKDTEGSNLAGKILRSPASGAAALTGGLSAPAEAAAMKMAPSLMTKALPYLSKVPYLRGAIPNLAETVGLAIPSASAAAGSQIENASEGKDVSLPGAALETAGGIVGGKALGSIMHSGLNKLTGIANKSGADKLYDKAITKAKDIAKTPKEIFQKYDLRGKAKDVLERVSNITDNANKSLDESIDVLSHPTNPFSKQKVDAVDILTSVKPKSGESSEFEAAYRKMLVPLEEISKDGKMDLKQLVDFKRRVGEIRDFETLNPKPKLKKVAGKVYDNINKKIDEMFTNVPEDDAGLNAEMVNQFKNSNEILSDLISVKKVLQKNGPAIDAAKPGLLEKVGDVVSKVRHPIRTVAGSLNKKTAGLLETDPKLTLPTWLAGNSPKELRLRTLWHEEADPLIAKNQKIYDLFEKTTDAKKLDKLSKAYHKNIEKLGKIDQKDLFKELRYAPQAGAIASDQINQD